MKQNGVYHKEIPLICGFRIAFPHGFKVDAFVMVIDRHGQYLQGTRILVLVWSNLKSFLLLRIFRRLIFHDIIPSHRSFWVNSRLVHYWLSLEYTNPCNCNRFASQSLEDKFEEVKKTSTKILTHPRSVTEAKVFIHNAIQTASNTLSI